MINLNIPGFCPMPQLAALETLSQQVRPNGIIVEVGSLFGRTAFTLVSSSDQSVKVYCVDPWDGAKMEAYSGFSMKRGVHLGKIKNTLQRFRENLGDFSERVFPIREYSPLNSWSYGNVDIVYIDGDHTYEAVNKDIQFWIQFLKPGGVICGDDYALEYGGVVRAVNENAKKCQQDIVALGKFWLYRNSENLTSISAVEKRYRHEWDLYLGSSPN